MTWRRPDITRDEREAVAAILALGDGPWEFFASIAQAAAYHVECRERLPVIYHYDPRTPKPRTKRPYGGECKQV